MQYEIIRSKRKTMSISVTYEGRVIVRVPLTASQQTIQEFVDSKTEWAKKNLTLMEEKRRNAKPILTQEELQQLSDAAAKDLPPRVARYAAIMGVTYSKITIEARKSRWGSCDTNGCLTFNCLLMLCPEEIRDYLVVHELAHRKKFNHSAWFWVEVEKYYPEFKARKKWLKANSTDIIRRLG